jgi:hypothetical protein
MAKELTRRSTVEVQKVVIMDATSCVVVLHTFKALTGNLDSKRYEIHNFSTVVTRREALTERAKQGCALITGEPEDPASQPHFKY